MQVGIEIMQQNNIVPSNISSIITPPQYQAVATSVANNTVLENDQFDALPYCTTEFTPASDPPNIIFSQ